MTRIVRLSMCLGLFMSVHAKAATVREAGEAVREAYYDVLGRAPDPEGMKTYRKRVLEDGWSAGRIRDVLRESAEYKDNREDIWIRRSHQAVLGREPDPAGHKACRKALKEEGWFEERYAIFFEKAMTINRIARKSLCGVLISSRWDGSGIQGAEDLCR